MPCSSTAPRSLHRRSASSTVLNSLSRSRSSKSEPSAASTIERMRTATCCQSRLITVPSEPGELGTLLQGAHARPLPTPSCDTPSTMYASSRNPCAIRCSASARSTSARDHQESDDAWRGVPLSPSAAWPPDGRTLLPPSRSTPSSFSVLTCAAAASSATLWIRSKSRATCAGGKALFDPRGDRASPSFSREGSASSSILRRMASAQTARACRSPSDAASPSADNAAKRSVGSTMPSSASTRVRSTAAGSIAEALAIASSVACAAALSAASLCASARLRASALATALAPAASLARCATSAACRSRSDASSAFTFLTRASSASFSRLCSACLAASCCLIHSRAHSRSSLVTARAEVRPSAAVVAARMCSLGVVKDVPYNVGGRGARLEALPPRLKSPLGLPHDVGLECSAAAC
eukprot:scaffold183584_cov28-Tisochrysis_lutea.AAC.9